MFVCFCISNWGFVLDLSVRVCVCVFVVSSSMCVTMMSVSSVSTTKGGVIADVLALL